MKFTCILLLIVGCAATEVTPVQKVIQLMNGKVEKTTAIAEANEMIDVLKADIEKYAADAERLAKEIADLEKDIATFEADIAGATKQRETEKAAYEKQHQ